MIEPAVPPTDQSTQSTSSTTHVTGGVNVTADDMNIGGDVIARDKIGGDKIEVRAEAGATIIVGTDRAAPQPAPLRPSRLSRSALVPIGIVVLLGLAAVAVAVIGRANRPIDPASMVYVEAGSFTMGSDVQSAKANAKPAHVVDLNAFWIDQHEVTNHQYLIFVQQTGHAEPTVWQAGGGYPTGRDELPVIGVSWYDADAYCRFVGRRLPTEAEWEKAARGTDQRQWPWGNEWDKASRANANTQGRGSLKAVGSYPDGRSPYGADDMAGNVWEWVQDWYEAEYYQASPPRAPTGPTIGQTKVMRGGAWPDDQNQARVFTRLGVFPPDYTSDVVGFRCACTDCRSR